MKLLLGVARDESSRENIVTIPALVFFPLQKGIWIQYYEILGREYFYWEHLDYNRESVTQNKNFDMTNDHFNKLARRNKYNQA